jgi:hypothetical protein
MKLLRARGAVDEAGRSPLCGGSNVKLSVVMPARYEEGVVEGGRDLDRLGLHLARGRHPL